MYATPAMYVPAAYIAGRNGALGFLILLLSHVSFLRLPSVYETNRLRLVDSQCAGIIVVRYFRFWPANLHDCGIPNYVALSVKLVTLSVKLVTLSVKLVALSAKLAPFTPCRL